MENISNINYNWWEVNTDGEVSKNTINPVNTVDLSKETKEKTEKDVIAPGNTSEESNKGPQESLLETGAEMLTNSASSQIESISETGQGTISPSPAGVNLGVKKVIAPTEKDRLKTFNNQLKQIIFTYVTVFVDKWAFSGILVGIFKDFLILVNGCKITEIRLREINAVEFKAWGCPKKRKEKSLKRRKHGKKQPRQTSAIMQNIFKR
jgi:hypothetical protein